MGSAAGESTGTVEGKKTLACWKRMKKIKDCALRVTTVEKKNPPTRCIQYFVEQNTAEFQQNIDAPLFNIDLLDPIEKD